jgi:hypothetical protein
MQLRWRAVVLAALIAIPLLNFSASAQGLDTRATKDDWEEINFEFNSSVLVDGFPSLLRIAELLQKNPTYKVKVEGHTDRIGSAPYNDKLGTARASTVRDFLVKYGARAAQIETSSRGFAVPRAGRGGATYSRTDEARYMNRRVSLTVTDGQGRPVGAGGGGAGDVIRALEPAQQAAQQAADCCNQVLKKLDKLDTIEQMLKDLADQNKALRDQLAALKQDQDALKAQQQALAAKADQTATRVAEAPKPPSTDEVAKAVAQELKNAAPPRFQLLGVNVGPTGDGNATFTGKGRFFAPFGDHYGFQSEGEYFYSRGQREGQFDFGLVDRIGNFQAGLFSSLKHVNLTGNQTGGTLGQGALTLDYIFKAGKIGVFGTKAFLDDSMINSVNTLNGVNNLLTQRYLRVVDQAGISGTAPLFGRNYFEGNVGYLRSTTAGDRIGGTLRLIFPINDKVAFTAEGGVNETLLGAGNTGRAVFGVQFGNFMKPRELQAADHAVPVQIPRLRYEVLTRTARAGNNAPVADAGPNQTITGSATITLNGSASYDPDGDPITYAWVQESGPAVILSSLTTATTQFSAVAGNTYTFRLTVRDTGGLQGIARVTVSASQLAPPQVLSFTATPSTITQGQSSVLGWQVVNADSVTITSLGNVALTGSAQVSPPTTTTYTLTATRGSQTATANITVTVNPPVVVNNNARITNFSYVASQVPNVGTNIELICSAVNSVKINVNGIEFPYPTVVIRVDPTIPTTYTCTAFGANGVNDVQTLTVAPLTP